MRFGVLGPVEAHDAGGTPVAVGGPRVRSLLALLLLNAGKLVTTEALIDGLYGEEPPGDAANALQSQVSRLRRALPGVTVEFHPAGYRLAIDPDEVDVHRFTRLVVAGRQATDPAEAESLLGQALALWRGPALADLSGVPFAEGQSARLDEARQAAIEDHVEALLRLGRHRDTVEPLREIIAARPLRERPYGQLMRALYGSGRQAEALTAYEDLRTVLADELGADPSPEISSIHLAVLRNDPELAVSPPEEPDVRPGLFAVPAQVSSFVGRDKELARIADLLGSGRLVTLLGPGGAGKTRLAVEAAGRHSGEVCFVDLAPLTDGSDVEQAVLSALGVRESQVLHPGVPAAGSLHRLIEALVGRAMLLIFDNCEHVVDHTARLVHRLLEACPGLRVLATSREALAITGEALVPLPPLPLPRGEVSVQQALGYPAVRLFAERAGAVRPGFEIDHAVLPDVLRICAALDGLPLAIELAAARLRSLTVAEVAARLDDRFRLLSRGDRTAAPRHQTLRAVVEWSWDLLDEPAKALARRLTVFHGGATLPVIATVCHLDTATTAGTARPTNVSQAPDIADVEELLTELTDKSLVERVGDRYRMLDTIRAFCGERLVEAGEDTALRAAHLACYLDLVTEADPHLRQVEQTEWLDRLTSEHANLHAALRWATYHDTRSGLRLLAYLSWYWWMRGLRGEAAPLAAELLTAVGDVPPDGLEEEYLLCLLNTVHVVREHERQQATLDQINDVGLRIKGRPRYVFTPLMWALAVGPEVRADVRASMEEFFGDDPWSRGLWLLGNGLQAYLRGDLATAEVRLTEAGEEFDAHGDRWGTAQALDTLAVLAIWRGDRDRFLELVGRAIGLVTELNAVEDMADLLCRRAGELGSSGDAAAALADYKRATELARRAGKPSTVAWAHSGMGDLARLAGDTAEARRLYDLALRETEDSWFAASEPRALALVGLAELSDVDAARPLYREAMRCSLTHRFLPVVAKVIEAMAGTAVRAGDGLQAASLLGAAVAVRGGPAADREVAQTRQNARELAGEPAYEAAYAAAVGLDTDAAITLAEQWCAAPSHE